jgi:hypothetical protein
MIRITHYSGLCRYHAHACQLLRFVMVADRLVDKFLLSGRERYLERILPQNTLCQLLPQFDVPLFGIDRLTRQRQSHNAAIASDLLLRHPAPARIVEDEGQMDHLFVHGSMFSIQEFLHKGQTNGYMNI